MVIGVNPRESAARNAFSNILKIYQYAGNTPTGNYQSAGGDSNNDWPQASYGSFRVVQLKVIAGEAQMAERLGKQGLLIRGGAPEQFQCYRPTKGSLPTTRSYARCVTSNSPSQ